MNTAFPAHIAGPLTGLLEGVSRKDLGARAGKLSAAYRAGKHSGEVRDRDDVLAYLLARAPATFAAAAAVFARAKEVTPALAPASLLDIGAGPGTASWAAMAAWSSLNDVTLLESHAGFRAIAAQLLPAAYIIAADLRSHKPKADLVTAAYVLAELPENLSATVARELWDVAGQALVLIEPGTPQGFARIRAARQALIEAGAHIAAPCTHDNQCPMTKMDWCHFSQRLSRSRDHMRLKDASVPFEDERYCYVVATREKIAAGARIIKPPVAAKPGITLPLCDADGLRDHFVAHRDKEAFKRARKLEWGDLL